MEKIDMIKNSVDALLIAQRSINNICNNYIQFLGVQSISKNSPLKKLTKPTLKCFLALVDKDSTCYKVNKTNIMICFAMGKTKNTPNFFVERQNRFINSFDFCEEYKDIFSEKHIKNYIKTLYDSIHVIEEIFNGFEEHIKCRIFDSIDGEIVISSYFDAIAALCPNADETQIDSISNLFFNSKINSKEFYKEIKNMLF